MRRRWFPLAAVVFVAACSGSDDVALVSSEQITDTTTPTTESPPPTSTASTPTTSSGTDPEFTLPPPPETTPTTGGSTVPPSTVPDLPVPDDCVPLPDDAPALLVTSEDGVVYQVGTQGTQIVADSDELDAPITSAWRAQGGVMWVSLGDQSLGRFDAGNFTESAAGNASLQHVGLIDGEPVALWLDLEGQFSGADEGGRIVIEHADGSQDDLGPSWTSTSSITVGNIGAETVLLTRVGAATPHFDYLDATGSSAHDDWYNPTDQAVPSDRVLSSAAVDDDGSTLIWTEETTSGEMTGLRLVIGSTSGADSNIRVLLATPPEVQSTGDFDGRWAIASFTDVFSPTKTVLVDTTAETPEAIVPCIPLGAATIDRAGGGSSTDTTTTSTPTTAPSTTPPTTTGGPVPPGSIPTDDTGGRPVDP